MLEALPFLFQVIDGQHRINGAYFAVRLLQEEKPGETWEARQKCSSNLDPLGKPQRQAQIFIDVNFNQKKGRSITEADLYPTKRENREAQFDDKERAQDIGRKLMLEAGPLVGMIQIPGIRYGVKGCHYSGYSELMRSKNILPALAKCEIGGLEIQTDFLAQCSLHGSKHRVVFIAKGPAPGTRSGGMLQTTREGLGFDSGLGSGNALEAQEGTCGFCFDQGSRAPNALVAGNR